jgi:hypothetical protein
MTDVKDFKTAEPIRLDFTHGSRQVVVHAADEDRFLMTCEEAARACKRHMTVVEWKQEFTRLLAHLRKWIEQHLSTVEACYADVRDGQLVIFILPKGRRFDMGLAEEIAALEYSLPGQFPICDCEVMQVPATSNESLTGFMNPERSILVYGG